eukprot:6212563-Pleurochrysis_carterae.AAC.2
MLPALSAVVAPRYDMVTRARVPARAKLACPGLGREKAPHRACRPHRIEPALVEQRSERGSA